MDKKNIGVVGSGQMGAGIAQVLAQSGHDVMLVDVSQERVGQGLAAIAKSLDRFVRKEKITGADKDTILERLSGTTKLTDLSDADLVVEAVSEDEGLKKKIFAELDQIVPAHGILASNTSSISITRIAAATNRPEQVIGMHFMNPVPIMKLVEIVRGLQTSDGTYEQVRALAESVQKVTVVAHDFPGFIVNRVLMPMLNEAFYAVHEGVGSVEDIDVAMKLGTNQPMGPFELADFIGLDTTLAILNVMHEGLGARYFPCPLLQQYVDAGYYGRKVGRGFYTYDSSK
ncbi:MAG: 3-hydroxybutyryl-CoA dehydrogenase [Myxococcales bacterium]|nr:3-hydroxybutyryl-CoA dehydrogenase [Myxococcales bacterium]|tara:strand:+ start:1210 stop:2067 length:858 start_codon:yes stop_codon:yes gene_type:complete